MNDSPASLYLTDIVDQFRIVFLSKHFASATWRTLSVPRGGTRRFNAEKFGRGPTA